MRKFVVVNRFTGMLTHIIGPFIDSYIFCGFMCVCVSVCSYVFEVAHDGSVGIATFYELDVSEIESRVG